jgi:N-acetylglucosaminyldiphosphoundecaprenol N-acetyl-beta-D-mannosaminyltransferase
VTRAEFPGPIGHGPRRLRATLIRRASSFDPTGREAVHRTFDLVSATIIAIVLSPLLLLRTAVAVITSGRIFDRQMLLGRSRIPFERLWFAGCFPGRGFAALANILRGDLSWTGPRPLSEGEAAIVPPRAWVRFQIRPGLMSTHSLRARVGIAYEDENSDDRDFFYSQTVGSSLGVLARAVPSAIIAGTTAGNLVATLRFFGVDIVNTTMEEAVGWIISGAKSGINSQLCFVNPDCLNIAYTDSEYQQVLKHADRVLPDGIGIHLACRISGTSLIANVNGTDLFPRMCEKAAREELSIFLLGSGPGRAESAARNMQEKFERLRIAGTHTGYFETADELALIEEINRSGADILLVGLGAPRQDLWLANNLSRLRPAVKIGVGGLFDFYSKTISRAPQWMREIGMEWSWRLMMEPRRMWRRYVVGNPLFLLRVWHEAKFGHADES